MPKLVETPLTEDIVRNAELRNNRYDLYDAHVRGLALRVSPSGNKSWVVMKRVYGKLTRKTLGRYPSLSLSDARALAREVIVKIAREKLKDSMLPKPSDRTVGWKCPVCGAGVSPYEAQCPNLH